MCLATGPARRQRYGRRGEAKFVVLNVIYLALAAFIAWGRFGPEPFTS